MSHTSSMLSEAAHPSTAKFADGKGAPNQERARKNPTGTAATPFFGRAELGATRASLQLRRGKGEGLRPLSQPPNTQKIQCQGKVVAEKVQEVTPQSRISGLFGKDVAAHCADEMQEFHLPLCYREKHPGKQERCKGKGLGSWRVQGGFGRRELPAVNSLWDHTLLPCFPPFSPAVWELIRAAAGLSRGEAQVVWERK